MYTKSIRTLIVPALIGLAFALTIPTISAQEKAPTEKTPKAKRGDANKDGVVSEEEKAAAKAESAKKKAERETKAFAKYDANKNGVLDPDEKAQQEADRKAEREKKKADHAEKKAAEPKEN